MSSLKYEAANWPHYTRRAADQDGPHRLKWGGSERITQTKRGTCWWKLILEESYLLWGAEKDVHVCSVNTDVCVICILWDYWWKLTLGGEWRLPHRLSNKCMKHYYNWTILVQVIVKDIVGCLVLRRSVYQVIYDIKMGTWLKLLEDPSVKLHT